MVRGRWNLTDEPPSQKYVAQRNNRKIEDFYTNNRYPPVLLIPCRDYLICICLTTQIIGNILHNMPLKELEFNWDQWNIQKNEIKHGVSRLEAESIFFDPHLKIFKDIKHSTTQEQRWICYGKSRVHRILMIAFTLRRKKIRIISARQASKKERQVYENG